MMRATTVTVFIAFQGRSMAIDLSEEMRKALFGASVEPMVPKQAAATVDAPSPNPRTKTPPATTYPGYA
jgi:hypothetical protein